MALNKNTIRVLLSLSIFISSHSFAQKKLTITIDKEIEVPLMGYNSDMSNTPIWSEPNFSKALNQLHPKTLRYPGGSNGLYWDWEKGWTMSFDELLPILQEKKFEYEGKTIANVDELRQLTKDNRKSNSFWRQLHRYNAKRPKYNTIEEFSKALSSTQSKAVITLNVITSHLEKELELLRRAKKIGIDVKYIELGNEVYAENLLTKHIYPTVDNYIDTCISWSKAILKEFPNAHIGVVGGDKNRRTRNWNEKLSSALKRSFSTSKLDQFHFILHYYSHFKNPKYQIETNSGYKKLIAFPKVDLEFRLQNWRWNNTSTFSTWVTEYNMIEQQPYSINNKWAHGLLVASQINELLKQTDSEMFHFHSIGAEKFPVFAALQLMDKGDEYLKPTSSGIVTSLWNRLTENADRLYQTKINVRPWTINYNAKSKEYPNNLKEEKNTTFSPIHAYISYEDQKAKLLIINFSEEMLTIDLDKIMGKCEMEQHYAQPSDSKSNVIKQSLESEVELAPYSISLLEE
ncbi:MAG: hypothetical protein ISP73_07240 [Flavobacteriales bacterium]|nr:hypothetical protein [Flavobacteriales bacterium]